MFQYNDVFAELTLVTLVIRVILDGIRHYLLNDFPDVPWCKYNDDTVSPFDANDLPGVLLCVAVCCCVLLCVAVCCCVLLCAAVCCCVG